MRQRALVVALVVLTALFAWGLGWIAWGFVRAGGAVGWGFAIAVVILLVLTVWVTWREVLFGIAAARLARAYDTAREDAPGADAVDDERTGDPGAARREFESARRAAEANEDDWRSWYRLGLAYEALRDRRHARECVRRAIDLEKRPVRAGRAAAAPR